MSSGPPPPLKAYQPRKLARTESTEQQTRANRSRISGEEDRAYTLSEILEELENETPQEMDGDMHSNDLTSGATARAPKYVQRGTRHSDRPVTSFRHGSLHQHNKSITGSSQTSELSYAPGQPDMISVGTMHRSSSSQERIAPSYPAEPPASFSLRVTSQPVSSTSHTSSYRSNHGTDSGTTFRNSKSTIPSQPYTLEDHSGLRESFDTSQLHQTEIESVSEPDSEDVVPRVAHMTFNSRPRSLIDIRLAVATDQTQTSLKIDAVAQKLGLGSRKHVASWKDYLNSYCNGEYNLNNPPKPNMPLENFYLPAPYPSNESERAATAYRYVQLWSAQDAMEIAELAESARGRYNVDYAVVSFFTQEREVRLAESFHKDGRREVQVQRESSLLAHVLYSRDILVVLDARKDWRFRNSPAVVGWPEIRFFAAAPIIVNDHVIGTFALFDQAPRSSFSQPDRALLVGHGDHAIFRMNEEIYETSSVADSAYRCSPTYRPKVTQSSESRTNSQAFLRALQEAARDEPVAGSLDLKYGDFLEHDEEGPAKHGKRPSAEHGEESIMGEQHSDSSSVRTTSPLLRQPSTTLAAPNLKRKSNIHFDSLNNPTVRDSVYTKGYRPASSDAQQVVSAQKKQLLTEVHGVNRGERKLHSSASMSSLPSASQVPLPSSANRESRRSQEFEYAPSIVSSDNASMTTFASSVLLRLQQVVPSRTDSEEIHRQEARASALSMLSGASNPSSKDSQGQKKAPHVKGSSKIRVPGLGIEIRSPIVCSPTIRSPIVFAKSQPSSAIRFEPSLYGESDATSIRSELTHNSNSSRLSMVSSSASSSASSFRINRNVCACTQIAINLGYDLVYIMATETSKPLSTDNITLTIKSIYPDGAEKDIQSRLGEEQRAQHALAMYRGRMTCDIKKKILGGSDLTWGTLIPLHPIDPAKPRSKGLVLGAFRTSKKPDDAAFVKQIEETLHFAVEPCIEDQMRKEAKREAREMEKLRHRESSGSERLSIPRRVAEVQYMESYRPQSMNRATDYRSLLAAKRGMDRPMPALRHAPSSQTLKRPVHNLGSQSGPSSRYMGEQPNMMEHMPSRTRSNARYSAAMTGYQSVPSNMGTDDEERLQIRQRVEQEERSRAKERILDEERVRVRERILEEEKLRAELRLEEERLRAKDRERMQEDEERVRLRERIYGRSEPTAQASLRERNRLDAAEGLRLNHAARASWMSSNYGADDPTSRSRILDKYPPKDDHRRSKSGDMF